MHPYVCVGCSHAVQELSHNGMYLQCNICRILYKKHRNAGIEPVWVTETKEVLPISEIPLAHLRNIIGLMLIHSDWCESYRKPMLDELELRLEQEKADGPPA